MNTKQLTEELLKVAERTVLSERLAILAIVVSVIAIALSMIF